MKPKLLFILHLPPPVHGAAIVGVSIKKSISINDSFEITYLNLSTSKHIAQVGKGGFRKIFHLLKLINQLVRILIQKNFELVYMTLTASGPGLYKDLVIVFILKLFNCNIIYHFHNKGVANASRNKCKKAVYTWVFQNTSSILLSERLYPDIKEYVCRENVFICPNGIPDETTVNLLKNKGVINSNTNLLFLSNMMEEKGVYELLQACNILKRRGVKFQTHFVGAWSDINEKDFNAKVRQLELDGYVSAHGEKYNNEKDYYLNEADIFVFPTFYNNEAFPLVNLEAMRHGIPIISTPEGGITDMVVDGLTGYLVPQRNITLLADKLNYLICNPEVRLQMGVEGRKRFNQYFTFKCFEQKFVQIINKKLN